MTLSLSIPPGTTVETDDVDGLGGSAVIAGVVRAPSAAELAAGEREHGDELVDAVLVAWETGVATWEFVDALRVTTPTFPC